MNKEQMIDDIVAMLDGRIKKGEGHINLNVDMNVDAGTQRAFTGCAECSAVPTACSVPTMELPGDDEFQK